MGLAIDVAPKNWAGGQNSRTELIVAYLRMVTEGHSSDSVKRPRQRIFRGQVLMTSPRASEIVTPVYQT